MSDLSDDEYRAWIDAGSPNALEAWGIITALRAERDAANALLLEASPVIRARNDLGRAKALRARIADHLGKEPRT